MKLKQGFDEITRDFERRSQKLVFMNVSKKVASILEPLTNINPRMYHCQSESDMLEVLFMMKSDEILKTETVPLLSDTFRKNQSISSEICSTEVNNKEDNDNRIDGHETIQGETIIENNVEINHISTSNTNIDKTNDSQK